MHERVELKTADGITVAGNHYKGREGSPGILLVHMLPATKEWWDGFARMLYAEGFGVLAIDLRGHGESHDGPGGYRLFSETKTQESIQDVMAAVDFQKKEKHTPRFIMGASIGANFSLRALARDRELAGAVLLSPGINYHGVTTIDAAKKITKEQSVFIVASEDDERRAGNAADMAREIFNALATPKKELQLFHAGGHGNDLFLSHPDLKENIVAWLKNK